ncbi:MAG: NADH-quinone oxidoreductase subunit NuoE [Bacteroidetes bacterium]|jgi:NADH-quinone oxidoreductase subunit E|nr:NADH-quinone oxidoreductase subunit NuoE [Bacteroidota bacterium]MBP7256462.1 NADH-quinone oxidoreductase subunit NuoE [Chitinophagales bacterium]MBK7639385.1 NADH-quinone oxidoreductase subunit NuoE [Bacteroidota bacterium]MBK8674566.1 NADH-quinone oxidoreductase subunit NuoE [Bacteroidota bacterium]MBK9352762.1 NADH-quinone oxidoreductase subunit NuoE [Bacteroidota bacterium]
METKQQIAFTTETMDYVQSIIKRYPEGKQKSALIPILHVAQAEFDGWLSVPTMDYVASILGILPIEVYEVASFYSMFNLEPVGKYLIEVCQTSSCWLNGAEDIVRFIEKKLNIKNGETTEDGMFTIKTVECLGSCGTAPMLQLGETYHENLTLEKVTDIIENCKTENKRSRYC